MKGLEAEFACLNFPLIFPDVTYEPLLNELAFYSDGKLAAI
jgi:hypothetical protein